jgi:hypothetical protein
LTLDCPDPVARLTKLKIADPDRINIFDTFEKWRERHGKDWVAASKLHDDVQQLLLRGRKFSRQRINYEVRALVGTRIANYLLEEKKSETNKWAAAEFRLIKTDSEAASAPAGDDTVADQEEEFHHQQRPDRPEPISLAEKDALKTRRFADDDIFQMRPNAPSNYHLSAP